MTDDARGILAIWHDIAPEHMDDVLAWYDAEHHFERLAVPGFLSVRRHHAVEGTRPFLFTRYETRGVDVLASPAYLARLNDPSPWTHAAQPRFRNTSRIVCVPAARAGRAEGGHVLTVRLAADGDADAFPASGWPVLAARLMGEGARSAQDPTGGGVAGVLGAELWRADRARSGIATAETRLRDGEVRPADAVIVIHARDASAARRAADAVGDLLPDRPGRTDGHYALAFAASNFSI